MCIITGLIGQTTISNIRRKHFGKRLSYFAKTLLQGIDGDGGANGLNRAVGS